MIIEPTIFEACVGPSPHGTKMVHDAIIQVYKIYFNIYYFKCFLLSTFISIFIILNIFFHLHISPVSFKLWSLGFLYKSDFRISTSETMKKINRIQQESADRDTDTGLKDTIVNPTFHFYGGYLKNRSTVSLISPGPGYLNSA